MNCCLSLKVLLSPQRQRIKTLNFVHVVGSINIDREEMIDLGVNSERLIANVNQLTTLQTMVLDKIEKRQKNDHSNKDNNVDDAKKMVMMMLKKC